MNTLGVDFQLWHQNEEEHFHLTPVVYSVNPVERLQKDLHLLDSQGLENLRFDHYMLTHVGGHVLAERTPMLIGHPSLSVPPA